MAHHTDRIRQLEEETGRIIIQAQLHPDGTVTDVVYAPFGYGDLVLNVWNSQITLCRVVREATTWHYAPVPLREWTPEQEAALDDWLHEALTACGGAINQSGQYPVVLPLPDALTHTRA